MVNHLLAMAAFMLTGMQSPTNMPSATPSGTTDQTKVLATHEFSLSDRYAVESVNNVFADNILITLGYLDGTVERGKAIPWDTLVRPFSYTFTLEPGQTFAFHDAELSVYQSTVVKTTNTHFDARDGFESDGFLYGDGVCHLASLLDWTAKDAGLTVDAPTNHNFAIIPDVPKEYGVAIYYDPNNASTSARENLYITNSKSVPVRFSFEHSSDSVRITISEDK